jgi:hypothetical protein
MGKVMAGREERGKAKGSGRLGRGGMDKGNGGERKERKRVRKRMERWAYLVNICVKKFLYITQMKLRRWRNQTQECVKMSLEKDNHISLVAAESAS